MWGMASCETCGEPVRKKHPKRPGRFCSRACYFASGPHGNRVEKTAGGSRLKRAAGHPLAPPSGTVAVCRLVLYEMIGPGSHPCHWCGNLVTWMPGKGVAPDALIADHLDWDQSNDSPENLVPSCNACNAHRTPRGDRQIIRGDEMFIVASNGARQRAVQRECELCGSSFVVVSAQVRVGKGRFCSRSCARTYSNAKRREEKAA